MQRWRAQLESGDKSRDAVLSSPRSLSTQLALQQDEDGMSKKKSNIQQLKFAGGHPPNYYAAGKVLKYARADGMACFHFPVVVCDSCGVRNGIYSDVAC